jgi:hypothetical protein
VSAVIRAFATAALVAACTGPSVSQPILTDASRFFAIDEVGLGPNGWVTLVNYTDVAASLDGVYVCQIERCVELPDVVVQPQGEIRVASASGSGLENVVARDTKLDLTPSDGEVAVQGSNDPANASTMAAYVEWGSTPHALTPVAIEAKLWQAGTYAPSAPHATRLWKSDANLWLWDPG